MMQQESGWQNPFGDGRAGESILEHLTAGQIYPCGPHDYR